MVYTFGVSSSSTTTPPGTAGTGAYYEISIPVGAKVCRIICLGAGGGGAAGRLSASGTAAGGGGGGGGGAYQEVDFLVADMNPRVCIAVPAGGPGGAAESTNSTNGPVGLGPATAYMPAVFSGIPLGATGALVGGTDGSANVWLYALAASGAGGAGGTTTTAAGGAGGAYGDFSGGTGGAGVTSGGAGSPGTGNNNSNGKAGAGGGSGGGMTTTLTGNIGGKGGVAAIAPGILANLQGSGNNNGASAGAAGGVGLNWSSQPTITKRAATPAALSGATLYDVEAYSELQTASPKYVVNLGALLTMDKLSVNLVEKIYGPSADYENDDGDNPTNANEYFRDQIGVTLITNLDVGFQFTGVRGCPSARRTSSTGSPTSSTAIFWATKLRPETTRPWINIRSFRLSASTAASTM